MRCWFWAIALALASLTADGWAQEVEAPQTEKLDGTVKGIVIGLSRVTLAVLSSRQIMTYLHTTQDKLPSWVRTGIEVTVHYRRENDGSLWVEQITPYKPPEPSQPTAATTSPQITVINPQNLFSNTPSQTATANTSPSRQGSILELRGRQMPSRGLTSSLQSRLSSLDPVEMEVARLLPHYKAAAKFFNPNLSDEMAETIATSILKSSIRNGVDPRLVVAVIACESSFKPEAIGKKGEIGLGQLKPETAEGLGVNPYDPVQNIDGCVRYLKQQLDRFGSVELALAAYNAGPNAVAKAGGIPQNGITPRYVQKVLDLYRRLCGQ
ncbi:MAG: lytic transglycosylase domain-containing protein [Candidatus Fervidibacter sp.]|uniref:lytic transglycosylase domain-containing protein n=1 Tax=Candidatus Fervidibacter sp. TaxID=3100871 RepID=UPI0040491F3E